MPDSGKLHVAHRLPMDVAAQIHGTAATDLPLVEMGSPRRRVVVLVLLLVVFAGGLAAGLH